MKKPIYLDLNKAGVEDLEKLHDQFKNMDKRLKSFILQELSIRKSNLLFIDNEMSTEVKYGALFVIESLIDFFAVDCERKLKEVIESKRKAMTAQPPNADFSQKQFNEKVLNTKGT